MKLRIHWTTHNMTQVRTLVNYCTADQKPGQFITMNSPIYKAIFDGSFVLNLGEFGRHPFTVETV